MSIPILVVNQLPVKKYAVENKDIFIYVFNFESEISKIKILVPLLELLKNPAYKMSLQNLLQPANPTSDLVNLEEERPTIYLGNLVQSQNEDNPPPFNLSLNIHDKLLHNCLLDSGASHNLMPKKVME